MLLFSPDSRTLFFNTTINTSIQAYSLLTGDLSTSSHSHPSQPNVLAISSNGDVLLSASPSPPTVLIQDRRVDGLAAVHFIPTNSKTAVTCAAFEFSCKKTQLSHTRLVLGFRDGTLAMYTVLLPEVINFRNSLSTYASVAQLQIVEVGAISKLHKASMGGVTAASFMTGYKSRVVSIGYDGRCRLVDFEQGGKKLRT